jgi:Holliday junction resolvase RusA-like endonuclease
VVSWAAAGAAVKAWRTGVTQCGREAAANAGGSAALGGLIGNAPLLLVVRFQFGTANAKRFGLVHTAKPDADNLAKLVMDALKDGGALGPADDARIGRLEASKVWAPQAGCVWTLYRLAGGEGDARGGLAALDGGEGADGMPGWLRLAPAGA